VNKKTVLAGVFIMFCALALSGCTSSSEVLEIGRPAPLFKLQDLSGQQISLDQYRGKIVLLDFWQTSCGPCRMIMPLLEKIQKEYPDSMVLLAINLGESRDAIQEYLRQQGLSSHVLLDQDQSVGGIYTTGAIPMQVLIDKEGIVRDIQIGFDPRVTSQLRAKIQNLL
jgi:thiol-disulfide isomerase/thioredoxin